MANHVPRCVQDTGSALPDWVPPGARNYLAHTERGASIRALARSSGCHASTVLRQIRKIETRRDDPLVDAALRKLGSAHVSRRRKERMSQMLNTSQTVPDEETLLRHAGRILRRLCETGAVLAVAAEMEKAVVVRDTANGGTARTAVVDAELAQAMALKEWIRPMQTGRVVRYQITPAGRAALAEMTQPQTTPSGMGFCEAQAPFANDHIEEWHETEQVGAEPPRKQRMRYAAIESPLAALARRKDKDGKPFLADALVHAGERLREDFEVAQMASRTTQNWDNFLVAGTGNPSGSSMDAGTTAQEARARVAAALTNLGPGLSDIVLRCCCYLEGLEAAEKKLGWSARSAKIVLRIALIRLSRYYDETIGRSGPMIG